MIWNDELAKEVGFTREKAIKLALHIGNLYDTYRLARE